VIPIREHVENISRLRAFMDGDSICITLDDFVNLQESPAYFVGPGEPWFDVLHPWVGVVENPVLHLPHGDRCWIAQRLTEQAQEVEG